MVFCIYLHFYALVGIWCHMVEQLTEEEKNAEVWRIYHNGDKRSTRRLARLGLIVVGLAGALTFALTRNDSPAAEDPAPTREAPPVDTRDPYSFTVGGRTFDCMVAEQPHTVVPGDNLWVIVEGQQAPDMPPRWVGTIVLNQAEGTVGTNPDLIYPGNEILTLEDCSSPGSSNNL